ncbi:MAG TPA: MarR family transcriptional regulator [Aggregatilinea sp.]|jgi:DNA-binding MarR family transcriptional regulator|uniref:MarR family winged helix-turn-helix transcriptional regulator n=1 Tax=Aggregatilinea sp. TaxID=2806333 RepID=UPI002C9B74C5|nr:MarR family transcriptional regulator [Aggregatilinea sp.]HML22429.1 MarR family transcriptional regulator [Aggregatilinea sp.]
MSDETKAPDQEHQCVGGPPEIEKIVNEIFQVHDESKIKLFRYIKATSHLMSVISGQYRKDSLSSARTHLLVRLLVAQRRSGLVVAQRPENAGVSPSELSQFLRVSRNTVSSLLNGLEEQGLIERRVHPTDRRQFLISITPEGETAVLQRAPEFSGFIDSLFDVLTPDEQDTLLALLDKLIAGLLQYAEDMGIDLPAPPFPVPPDSSD